MLDLPVLVNEYLRTKAHEHDKELDHFRRLRLPFTLEEAVNARGADGKMLDHQHRVGKFKLAEAYKRLEPLLAQIEKCDSFDSLLSLIRQATKDIPRFGDLAEYDTALRIGARLGKLPTVVYLHAGTKAGAKRLGFDTSQEYLTMQEIEVRHPELLRLKEPHHIENFLCCSIPHE
ncbi:MAG: hypothetical protein SH850_03060 [Planctomycetaceae bacterium]|nr:hypothetical protein [Planctomycetaceae bacterium]